MSPLHTPLTSHDLHLINSLMVVACEPSAPCSVSPLHATLTSHDLLLISSLMVVACKTVPQQLNVAAGWNSGYGTRHIAFAGVSTACANQRDCFGVVSHTLHTLHCRHQKSHQTKAAQRSKGRHNQHSPADSKTLSGVFQPVGLAVLRICSALTCQRSVLMRRMRRWLTCWVSSSTDRADLSIWLRVVMGSRAAAAAAWCPCTAMRTDASWPRAIVPTEPCSRIHAFIRSVLRECLNIVFTVWGRMH